MKESSSNIKARLKTRNKSLDGLRGIGALMVALSHSLFIVRIDNISEIWATPLQLSLPPQALLGRFLIVFLNGTAAVTIFFLISGYVLGQSLRRTRINLLQSVKFTLKRFSRLYPAYLLLIVASFIYSSYFHDQKTSILASNWYIRWFQFKPHWRDMIDNLTFANANLSAVTWTLKIEVIMAFFLPLIALFHSKVKIVGMIGMACILYFAGLFPSHRIDLSFAYIFYFGMLVPGGRRHFGNTFKKHRIMSTAILLYCFIMFFTSASLLSDIRLVYTVETLAGTYIFIFLSGSNRNILHRILSSGFLQFFGRISYSFYLFHFLILYILATLYFDYGTFLFSPGLVLTIAFFIAVLSIGLTAVLARVLSANFERPLYDYAKALIRKI